MAFEVRAAEPGEESAVVPLYEWLFAPPGSRPSAWDERRAAVALREAIDSHDACVLVAASGSGTLIGFCTAYQDMHSVRFGYRAWVEDLAVDPEQPVPGGRRGVARRRQGLGARAGRDASRARLGRGARRRASFLRARGRRLPGDLHSAGSSDAMARIVLFGATGYTGRLTAEALVARGARPLLAARSAAKLDDARAAIWAASSRQRSPTSAIRSRFGRWWSPAT